MPESVLILGDDNQVFLSVCRSLGPRGLKVHCAPHDLRSAALTSRYIAARHRLPPYAMDPSAWVASLSELITSEGVRLVMPTSDSTLITLASHAEEIGRERLALPDPYALRIFTDKAATRHLATELGIPVAEGSLVSSGGLRASGGAVRDLPLVLKPTRSHILGSPVGKLYARIFRSEAELQQELAGGATEFLAERWFDGIGVGLSVLAREGRVLTAYQHRRLRQAWETGPSSLRVSVAADGELEGVVSQLVKATCFTGVAMFEFRRKGPGDFVLLEVNPRFWGSLPVALEAGADFPAWLYDLLVHDLEPPPASHRAGVVKRDLGGEYRRVSDQFLAARGPAGKFKALLSGLGLLVAIARRRSIDTWAADDQQPLRREVGRLREAFAAGLAKRLPVGRRKPPSASKIDSVEAPSAFNAAVVEQSAAVDEISAQPPLYARG